MNKYIEKELTPTITSSIDHGQFGFIPGSSTTSNINAPPLADCTKDGNGSIARTALLDYSKAFDISALGVKPTTINKITKGQP